MSTIENSQAWSNISSENLSSKYEKCRNITEEIYKRINITFQIKKLEAGQSDVSENSDQIDSNELSNETDLFACDKSDISSSETEKPPTDCIKYININNNEEKKKTVIKRPKKRFRKRVKKRPARRGSDSEGSSDEEPLSRGADLEGVMTADTKTKSQPKEKKSIKKYTSPLKVPIIRIKPIEAIDKPTDKKEETVNVKNKKSIVDGSVLSVVKEQSESELKSCNYCSSTFKGDRGLRRHILKQHQATQKESK